MINKDAFIEYMNELQELCEAEKELNDILRKVGTDNVLWFDKHEILIVNILQDIFNDIENSWISYAIYELDWFKKYKDGMITENGKNVPLRDAGDLYDLLVDNLKNEEKR